VATQALAPVVHPATDVKKELVERARALIPALRERAQAAEEARRLPDATVEDFHNTGLFRILQPKRVGGYELDYGCQVDIAAQIGRGCGSSAFVLANLASHHWMLGMFPPQAQHDVWGPSTDALTVTSFTAESSKVEVVNGGYRISGHWKFASGVHFCDWGMFGIRIPRNGLPPEYVMVLVPKKDYQVLDKWFASGLRATGSTDIVIDDVFVPEHRSIILTNLKGQPTPGSAINPSYLYRLPLYPVLNYAVFSAAVGIARGAIESYVARTRNQIAKLANAKVAEFSSIQLRVAESSVEVDCAELLTQRNAEEFNATAKADRNMAIEDKVRYRRDTSYATMLCMRAVDRVMAVAGANGLNNDTVEQRAFRDIHALNQNVALMWDIIGIPFGRVMLGLDAGDPRL
jgi:3-hydroxy-9,10-secoandrosta-1,3,5(10)-triene-9,17-dione monooxygenase